MSDEDQTEERGLLAVSAHPDDAEFTCGGSLARWSTRGWRVHLVVCTDGGKGSHDPDVKPAELAHLRRQEQRAAAEVLGITQVIWLDYPDGELAQASNLVERLTKIFRRVRPHRLLSWDPWRRYELHPDHRAAGLATLDAVLAAGNPHYFPKQIAKGLIAHQIREVYLYGAEEPDTWVDITVTLDRKLAAIAHHRSQVERVPTLVDDVRQCNADYGRLGGSMFGLLTK